MFELFEGLIDFALSATGIASPTASYETVCGSTTSLPRRTGQAALALSIWLAAGTGGRLPTKGNAQQSTSARVVVYEGAFTDGKRTERHRARLNKFASSNCTTLPVSGEQQIMLPWVST
jgi:hypothetical protein